MAKRKKKQGLSPAFKAGFIIIVVVGIIWAYTTVSDPWYGDPEVVSEDQPIAMKDETPTAPAVQPESKPVEEVVETKPEVTETPEVEEEDTEAPEIQLPPADIMNDSFDYTADMSQFSDEGHYWSFRRNTDHTPVEGYSQGVKLQNFDAFFRVPTDEKVVYLTFDEGYENGFTPSILDTLAANNVQAAFFVTAPYVQSESALVTRMKEEGHVVGSHSVHHYDGNSGDKTALYDLANYVVVEEIIGVGELMVEKTGYPMDLFFRPPALLFSERTLYLTRQQGYKTIFCSMMYQDWYVNNQPGADVAYDHVMTNVHPGAIILLHAVSESNTEALDDIIKDLKAQGYRFGSLYEIQSAF